MEVSLSDTHGSGYLASISSQPCYARSIQTHGFGTKKNKEKHVFTTTTTTTTTS